MASITFETNSAEETAKLGAQFALSLTPGAIIGLVGDMGSGKTHFVKGLAKGLGFQGEVTSPTFNLVHEYATDKGTIYHVDLHRIQTMDELAGIGLEEIFDKALATLIEWPQIATSLFTRKMFIVTLIQHNETHRSVEIFKGILTD
ncbi:tRNA (adenosine(37)-N6)-threonylcarbamoyltransferase complex ATPase subunit type 1 TsaE [Kamptonema cortianum]|nr:tRNA (adenosine(37)-N6)-threonylcarbamoyltransferase complex ATPase subunit type 1 TsaE [Oscillatoria laete-virens]MDK3158000.1 tRNA (adenosine(37)-N6)-threonylcarbamoyltransferase complex ATPase subunit type 1 TsaE [Kamptonema cortianum]MDL5053122.1 tRNA (adenosine(37)-N6)-threonylcarbamoyltransferase complex ATPase subunit type 1 TsaE [Oscillatoria laete-virens NRMC-F 0139]